MPEFKDYYSPFIEGPPCNACGDTRRYAYPANGCVTCRSTKAKSYYHKHKGEIAARRRNVRRELNRTKNRSKVQPKADPKEADRAAAKRYYQTHKEQKAAYKREWRRRRRNANFLGKKARPKQTPEESAKRRREYSHKRYHEHKDIAITYRTEHKAELDAYQERYREKHKEEIRVRNQIRYQTKKAELLPKSRALSDKIMQRLRWAHEAYRYTPEDLAPGHGIPPVDFRTSPDKGRFNERWIALLDHPPINADAVAAWSELISSRRLTLILGHSEPDRTTLICEFLLEDAIKYDRALERSRGYMRTKTDQQRESTNARERTRRANRTVEQRKEDKLVETFLQERRNTDYYET